MSFNKISERCYCFPGAINIGLIVNDEKAIVIDTGMDKDSARKIARGLDDLQVKPVAIINTHAHADHCGGNIHLKKRYPALKIYSSSLEKALIEQPYYEGFYLFGGATPPKEMQTKFLRAEPSEIDEVLSAGTTLINGVEVEIIPLPGHTLGQIGVKVDEVLYCGDAFFGKEIVNKYGVPYFTDIASTLKTLDVISAYSGLLVPSHGQVAESYDEDIEKNIDAIKRICAVFLEALNKPLDENGLVRELAKEFNLILKGLGQYYLSRATVMAYLNYFMESEKVKYEIVDGSLMWKNNV